jgi:hypothetical protein
VTGACAAGGAPRLQPPAKANFAPCLIYPSLVQAPRSGTRISVRPSDSSPGGRMSGHVTYATQLGACARSRPQRGSTSVSANRACAGCGHTAWAAAPWRSPAGQSPTRGKSARSSQYGARSVGGIDRRRVARDDPRPRDVRHARYRQSARPAVLTPRGTAHARAPPESRLRSRKRRSHTGSRFCRAAR